MKNKSPLALIEQAIMLLVFSLAAILCLQAFVWADSQSRENAARDQALQQAQNAAELLKSRAGDLEAAARQYGGLWDGESWVVLFDEQWNQTDDMHTYTLRAAPGHSGLAYLGTAVVEVTKADGGALALLTVCWQEVAP